MQKERYRLVKTRLWLCKTDKRFVAHYKDGKWTKVILPMMIQSPLMNVRAYFNMYKLALKGLRHIPQKKTGTVCFHSDLNASRIGDSCRGLQIPPIPEEFIFKSS